MDTNPISCKISELAEILGWDESDDIVVEVGGTAISGINQAEGVNPKWSRQFGDRVYNKDAFIVIKNKTRNLVVPSQPQTNENS